MQLDEFSFDHEVKNSKDVWMIMFYSPDCPTCVTLTPKWEEAAVMLKGFVKMAKVDVTKELQLRFRYEIESFPSIKVFHRGFDYGKGETEQNIFEFDYNGQSSDFIVKKGKDLYENLQEEELYAKQEKEKKKIKSKKKKKSNKNKNIGKKQEL